jgi:hypothetical protein
MPGYSGLPGLGPGSRSRTEDDVVRLLAKWPPPCARRVGQNGQQVELRMHTPSSCRRALLADRRYLNLSRLSRGRAHLLAHFGRRGNSILR